MGKTYNKQSKKFDDEISSWRSGKPKKLGGLKTLNSYVEEDYDDPFEDNFEIRDDITIQHTKENTNT
jgi:hypothetical protein